MRLLLLLALAPVAALAQSGAVASLETDKDEYAYGETIELRYTIANESSSSGFTLNSGSESCAVGFTFGSLVSAGYATPCSLVEVWFEFEPGASRTWVWKLHPNELAVPESSGEHRITASFSDVGLFLDVDLSATTTFTAPEYIGGRVSAFLADGIVLSDVQDVMDALSAEVVHEAADIFYTWEIDAMTVADAVATYESDDRFESFHIHRELFYSNVLYFTDAEDAPQDGTSALTAARPNPFTTSTSFALTMPQPGTARVEVFDVLGRRVATLHDGPLTANVEHRFTFAAHDLPSGLYIVRATGDGYSQTRRLTLSR